MRKEKKMKGAGGCVYLDVGAVHKGVSEDLVVVRVERARYTKVWY